MLPQMKLKVLATMMLHLTVLKMILETMLLIMEVISLYSKGLHLLLLSSAAALKGLMSVLTVYLQYYRARTFYPPPLLLF